MLADLRGALAQGLDAHQDELLTFMHLADRFGSYADVWNAGRLLDEAGLLDGQARALQVSAWFQLFPEAARARPKTVLALIGAGGRGDMDNATLSGILTRWLEGTFAVAQATGRHIHLAGTLVAAAELASCWWPVSSWTTEAPGFASAFVDMAIVAASTHEAGPIRDHARLAKVFANALLVQDLLDDRDEKLEGADAPGPAELGVAPETPQTISADVQLADLVERLNTQRRRIWIVGALQAKWEHLMGIVKSYGLKPDIFSHVGYDQLKSRSFMDRLDLLKDVGVLLGPVPHSVADLGDNSSLVTKLQREAGIIVVELRAQSTSQELKISKTSFRSGLERLLADACVSGTFT